MTAGLCENTWLFIILSSEETQSDTGRKSLQHRGFMCVASGTKAARSDTISLGSTPLADYCAASARPKEWNSVGRPTVSAFRFTPPPGATGRDAELESGPHAIASDNNSSLCGCWPDAAAPTTHLILNSTRASALPRRERYCQNI